jgi:glycyl-tRNA synthetase
MIKDVKNGQCHRADKLIEEALNKNLTKKKNLKPEEREAIEKVIRDCEEYTKEQIDEIVVKYKIKAPDTGNDLSDAVPFNLMFATDIGPTGQLSGYLRPETAQGIFLNFKKLIEYNNGKMPCTAAQLGMAFRNEIHPKQGLLRVREFQMGEIEHFVDPEDKSHIKFDTIADIKLPLWTGDAQEVNGPLVEDLTLGQAVEKGVIGNQTMAYFMARSFSFLTSVGIRTEAIRYR